MRDFRTEQHVVINDDRTISVPKELRKIAVQFDHNVETVTFDCPRYWDGIDMSKMTVYVNYMRADRNRGMCLCKNVTVDETDDTLMHFTWTLTRNATLYNGKLIFLVCIKNLDESGHEINHWNSELCDQMQVSEGLECEESVMELHQDIITDLLLRMDKILIANTPILDKTLTERGLAADAKATGDAIGELNAYVAENFEIIDRDISAEEANRKAEIAVERKRIDQFMALKEGSTTGDAELIDARVGINGFTYNSLGEAVRDQLLASEATETYLASEIGTAKLIPYEFANVGNNSGVQYDDYFRGAFVKVKPGQKIRICANGVFNRFSFAFCNSTKNGSETLSAGANSTMIYSERYMEKELTVPDGYTIMLITLFVGEDRISSYGCDLKVYDISSEKLNPNPNVTHPKIVGTGAQNGKIEIDSVKGFIVRAQPNTRYKVTIRGAHNRCYYYGADEIINGKTATLLYNLNINAPVDYTEVIVDNLEYKYLVFTIAYTGDGFEPDCVVDVYEHYGDPIMLDGIDLNSNLDFGKKYDFYRSGQSVTNVETTAEVYALYDKLVSEHGDYVSKNKIGENSLGTDIYEYVFTKGDYNTHAAPPRSMDPVAHRPTILVISGVHGYERSAVMSTYSFMNDLCSEVDNLGIIRQKFCIKVVPVVTPYGFDNDIRVNENGVNIARNFDANWKVSAEGTYDYGGESVADQAETRAIQDWIVENSHAMLFIDYHNSGFEEEVSYLAGNAAIMSVSELQQKYFAMADSLTDYWLNERYMTNPYTIFAYTGFDGNFKTLATGYNYATKIGVQGVCLEASWNQNKNFGMHSSATISVGAEVLGNFILQFAK